MNRQETQEPMMFNKRVLFLLFSALKGVVISIIMITFFSLLTWAGLLPELMIWILSILSVLLGSFCSGFFCVKRIKWKPILIGIITGMVFFLILYSFGAVIFKRLVSEGGAFLPYLITTLCGGALGSVLAVSGGGRRARAN